MSELFFLSRHLVEPCVLSRGRLEYQGMDLDRFKAPFEHSGLLFRIHRRMKLRTWRHLMLLERNSSLGCICLSKSLLQALSPWHPAGVTSRADLSTLHCPCSKPTSDPRRTSAMNFGHDARKNSAQVFHRCTLDAVRRSPTQSLLPTPGTCTLRSCLDGLDV